MRKIVLGIGLAAAVGAALAIRHSSDTEVPKQHVAAIANGTPEDAPSPPSDAEPDWRQRVSAGSAFDKEQSARYPYNQVYIENPNGGEHYRLDSYNDALGEIVSRKLTQLSEIKEATAIGYVKELTTKYPPGAKIADVPSNRRLAGSRLQGQLFLEVPVQLKPIPQAVHLAAYKANIIIRDVTGKMY